MNILILNQRELIKLELLARTIGLITLADALKKTFIGSNKAWRHTRKLRVLLTDAELAGAKSILNGGGF